MATAVKNGPKNGNGVDVGKLYSQASKTRGNEESRQHIKEMTPEAREAIAPAGLKGKARDVFIKTGKTFSEQQEEAQAKRQARSQRASTNSKGKTPKEIASELEITPRQFRQFLRGQELGVGRGKRYGFTPGEARKLVNQYKREHPEAE